MRRSGELMQRISVMRPSTTKINGVAVAGEAGEPEAVQTKIAAEVRTASASRLERVFAAAVQATASHVVKIYAPLTWRVLHTDYLVWHDDIGGDRRLNVLGVADPDGRNREVLIAAMEYRG